MCSCAPKPGSFSRGTSPDGTHRGPREVSEARAALTSDSRVPSGGSRRGEPGGSLEKKSASLLYCWKISMLHGREEGVEGQWAEGGTGRGRQLGGRGAVRGGWEAYGL